MVSHAVTKKSPEMFLSVWYRVILTRVSGSNPVRLVKMGISPSPGQLLLAASRACFHSLQREQQDFDWLHAIHV